MNPNVEIVHTHPRTLLTLTVHMYSKVHLLSTNALGPKLSGTHTALEQMLKVQIICPVEQVDNDKRQWEGDSGVVVYMVGVLHMTTAYGAENLAEGGQDSEAPVGVLWRRHLRLGLTARGARGADSEFSRGGNRRRRCSGLLAPLGPASVSGNGGDDAVHFIVKVVHVVAILQEKEGKMRFELKQKYDASTHEKSNSPQNGHDDDEDNDSDHHDEHNNCDDSNDHNSKCTTPRGSLTMSMCASA